MYYIVRYRYYSRLVTFLHLRQYDSSRHRPLSCLPLNSTTVDAINSLLTSIDELSDRVSSQISYSDLSYAMVICRLPRLMAQIYVLVHLVTSKRRGPIQRHLPPREILLSSKPAFTVKKLGNWRLCGGGAISNRFQGLG